MTSDEVPPAFGPGPRLPVALRRALAELRRKPHEVISLSIMYRKRFGHDFLRLIDLGLAVIEQRRVIETQVFFIPGTWDARHERVEVVREFIVPSALGWAYRFP